MTEIKGDRLYVHLGRLAPNAASPQAAKSEVRPEGFEPTTLGSEDQCAIQLRDGTESLFN